VVIESGIPSETPFAGHPRFHLQPIDYMKDVWSHPPGSNRRPADYESAALPTELGWRSSIYTDVQRNKTAGVSLAAITFLIVPSAPELNRISALAGARKAAGEAGRGHRLFSRPHWCWDSGMCLHSQHR
jgi:hypothetical protein